MTDEEGLARSRVLAAASGHVLARAIHSASELRVADRLGVGAKSAEVLASECGADPVAMRRLLQFLARQGYFAVDEAGQFSVTETGRMLRADAPGNLAAVIRSLGSAEVWAAFARLTPAIVEGLPSEKRRGRGTYEPGGDPAEESLFGEAMAGYHWGEPQAIAAAYDFSTARKLVDIGGSSGRLLIAILRAHPHLEGVVYDRIGIAGDAAARAAEAGVGERCGFAGGDFFESVPAGADLYILSHILHDWSDREARAILSTCRRAAGAGATLLVAEALSGSPAEAAAPIPADMLLLANTEGRLRSRGEHEALLASAGYRLSRVIETGTLVSLIEAMPV